MITVEKVPSSSRETASIVKYGDSVIGYIRKFKNTNTEDFPWQAFAMDEEYEGRRVAGTLLGSFFGSKGKKEAVSVIVCRMLLVKFKEWEFI